jgi:hypothetical protein
MAAAILPVYEHIFEIAYVLPKLDLVAIPDFAAGTQPSQPSYVQALFLCKSLRHAALFGARVSMCWG